VTALKFHLACVPPKTNHHAKRIVRIGQFSRLADKPELVAAKQMLDNLLLPHQPVEPVAAPYAVFLEFTWPWLKGHSAKFRAAGRQPMTSKPDCDNSSKQICDRLVALRFIEDDRAIVDLHIRKWWGSHPGITVTIAPFTAVSIAHTEPPTWRADEALPLLNEVR
jgi:Holliday junction resolvase RusA-like endonuclease